MNVDLSKNNAFGDKYFLFVNAPTARSQSLIKWDNRFKQIPILSTLSAIFTLFQKLILIPAISFCKADLVKNNHYFNYIKRQEVSKCCILLVPILGDIVVYFLNRGINKLATDKFDHKTFSDYDKIAIRDALRAIPKDGKDDFINFVLKFYNPNKITKCNAAELALMLENLSQIPKAERQNFQQFAEGLQKCDFSSVNALKSYIEAFTATPPNYRASTAEEFLRFCTHAAQPTEPVKELIANRFGLKDSEEKELFNNFAYGFIGDNKDFTDYKDVLAFVETLKEIPDSERPAFHTLLPIFLNLNDIFRKSCYVETFKRVPANERENFADYLVKLIDDKMDKREFTQIFDILYCAPAKDRQALVQLALKFKEHWRANDAVHYIFDSYKKAQFCKRNFIDVTFNTLNWASQCTGNGMNDELITTIVDSFIQANVSLRKSFADGCKNNIKNTLFNPIEITQAYKLFGLQATCTDQELSAVLKKVSITCHPDKLRDLEPNERERREERLKNLNGAHMLLKQYRAF